MHTLAEEYTRRAVQLRNDYTLGTVDYERTTLGHVGNLAEVYVLYLNAEILVLVVRTVELQLRLEGYAVGQTTLQTLLDGVAGRINVIIDKLQNEVVPGVRDREVLLEDLVQPLVFTILGRRVHLEEVTERFELHLQQIGIRHPILDRCKANSFLFNYALKDMSDSYVENSLDLFDITFSDQYCVSLNDEGKYIVKIIKLFFITFPLRH